VSAPVYIAIIVGIFCAGILAARWRLVLIVIAVWGAGLGIAALAGAFHQTSEDSGGAVFFFFALSTMLSVILPFVIGTAAGRILRWIARQIQRHRAIPRSSLTG
jgi:hypothetical protein